jgi:hypothetical protein
MAESPAAAAPHLSSSWSTLPGDVFNTILESLPPAHRSLLPQVCSAWRALASSLHSDAGYWRTLCVGKWGPALLLLAPPPLRDPASFTVTGTQLSVTGTQLAVTGTQLAAAWRQYYMQRAAWFDLPASPYQLIQEEQRGDPWRVMVACQVLFATAFHLHSCFL